MASHEAIGLMLVAYIGGLFFIAIRAEKPKELLSPILNSPLAYTLTLAVYCTTRTYYGSSRGAASIGYSYLAIFIGPTIMAIFWTPLVTKLVKIKERFRITSLADFAAARYGKSESVGALATILLVCGIIPAIALQLKVITATAAILTGASSDAETINVIVVAVMIVFTIVFGLRKLDPTERHPGMMAAIAASSLLKLGALIAGGAFITWGLNDGFSDIFRRAAEADLAVVDVDGQSSASLVDLMVVLVLSGCSILFLPRQFHVAVVENTNLLHIRSASWQLPLYLFATTVFAIPTALAGLLHGNPSSLAEYSLLKLSLEAGSSWLVCLVFLGGFSAGTAMISVEAMTTATMISNHIVLPVIERVPGLAGLRASLLRIRWLTAAAAIGLGSLYYRLADPQATLVEMGMISFAAASLFAPIVIGGLYWPTGNKRGAQLGLILGFCTWFYTLFLPSVIRSHATSLSILTDGPFGLWALRPESLFGLSEVNPLTHGALWSIGMNLFGYVLGSIVFEAPEAELQLARAFATHGARLREPKLDSSAIAISDLTKKRADVESLFCQYFTPEEAREIRDQCFASIGGGDTGTVSIIQLAELYSEVERRLSGSIGATAAHAAVKNSTLISRSEQTALSAVYARMLAELRMSPSELKRKADYQRERADLLHRQSFELARQLEDRDRENREKTREIRETNERMAHEMKARAEAQRQREKLIQQLVHSARLAGMADVAMNVLHNVGNTLNSITVSAEILQKSIGRDPKIDRLTRVLEMLHENRGSIAEFLTNDSKGKHIPEYAGRLASHLKNQNRILFTETDALSKNIEHIRMIISMQQTYAKSSSHVESVQVKELIDDAIRICIDVARSPDVSLSIEPAEHPPFLLDRHKALQILVNLIQNAKNAVDESGSSSKMIRIRASKTDDRIAFEVSDNGIGIEKEALTSIFQAGFTTRKQGHGFGLHAGALMAKELGGRLSVASDGKNLGATFTLEVPFRQEEQ